MKQAIFSEHSPIMFILWVSLELKKVFWSFIYSYIPSIHSLRHSLVKFFFLQLRELLSYIIFQRLIRLTLFPAKFLSLSWWSNCDQGFFLYGNVHMKKQFFLRSLFDQSWQPLYLSLMSRLGVKKFFRRFQPNTCFHPFPELCWPQLW